MLTPEPQGSGGAAAACPWQEAAVPASSLRVVQPHSHWDQPDPVPPRQLSSGCADRLPRWDQHGEGAQGVAFVQPCAFPAHRALCPRGLLAPCNKLGLQHLAFQGQLLCPGQQVPA